MNISLGDTDVTLGDVADAGKATADLAKATTELTQATTNLPGVPKKEDPGKKIKTTTAAYIFCLHFSCSILIFYCLLKLERFRALISRFADIA